MGLPPDATAGEPCPEEPASQPPRPHHPGPLALSAHLLNNADNAAYLRNFSNSLKHTLSSNAASLDPSVEKALSAVGALPTRRHLIQFLQLLRPLTDSLNLSSHHASPSSALSKDKSSQFWSSQHLPRSAGNRPYDWPVSNHSTAKSFTDDYDHPSLYSTGSSDSSGAANVHHAKISDANSGSLSSTGSMVHIMRPREREVWAYKRFLYLQQCPCKELAVNIIREIDPKKQQDFPYKRARSGGSTQRPPFWPNDPTIRNDQSPSHLKKDERIRLLVHFLFLPVNNYEYYQEWQGKTAHSSWADMLEYAVECTTLRSDGPKRAKGAGNPDSGTNRRVDRAQILREVSDDEKVKIQARKDLLAHLCVVAREVEMGADGGRGPDILLRLPPFPEYYARKEEASESRRRKRKSPLGNTDKHAASKIESDSENDEEDDEPFTEQRPSRASSVTPAEEEETIMFTDDESSTATKPSPGQAMSSQIIAVDKKRKLPGSPRPTPGRLASTANKRPSLSTASRTQPSQQQAINTPISEINPGFAVSQAQVFVPPTHHEPTYQPQSQQQQQQQQQQHQQHQQHQQQQHHHHHHHHHPNFNPMGYQVAMSSFGNDSSFMMTSPLTPDSRRISLQSPMPLSSTSTFIGPQAPWNNTPSDLQLSNLSNMSNYCGETFYSPDGAYDGRNMHYLYDGMQQQQQQQQQH